MKAKSLNILLVAFLLIGIFSIMLITFLGQVHEDFPKNITIDAGETSDTVFTVRDLQLSPAEYEEYTVNLVCGASGSYHISLEYTQTRDGGMSGFVNVVVTSGDQVVYQGPLDALFQGEVVTFDGELRAKDPLPVTIRYEMPYEIGNEAQGTSSDFDVRIAIEKS